MTRYLVGTSGWHYAHWRGTFYPAGLPPQDWLGFYAKEFATVEINNTFYRQPSGVAVAGWRDAVPEGFTCAVKASRYITHVKRLKGITDPVGKFTERISPLDARVGPFLYQTPPQLKRDDAPLAAFLDVLPAHLRHAIEFRHKAWADNTVNEILKARNVAWCIFDLPGYRTETVATADFAYVRFHGNRELYTGGYTDRELGNWA